MARPFVLFDLDNTLYPPATGLLSEMNRRIGRFVAGYFGISLEEAEEMRRGKPALFGTTLQWLRICHGLMDPEPYIEAIHPIDMNAWVEPDPQLRTFILELPVDYVMLTNSPMEHALRTLKALKLEDLFPRIWDLRRLGYRGKPHKEAYERILGDLGLMASETLLVDDSPDNIKGFEELGGEVLSASGIPSSVWMPRLNLRLRAS